MIQAIGRNGWASSAAQQGDSRQMVSPEVFCMLNAGPADGP